VLYLLSAAMADTLSVEEWKPLVPPFDFLQYVEEDEDTDSTADMDTLAFASEREHGQ